MDRVPDRPTTDTALQLEALTRVEAARTILSYVLEGRVHPQPWLGGARRLLEVGERLFEVAP